MKILKWMSGRKYMHLRRPALRTKRLLRGALTALLLVTGLSSTGGSAEEAGWNLGGCTFPLRIGAELLNTLALDRTNYYYAQAFTYAPGTMLVIRGEFPHTRFMNFVAYDADTLPIASIADVEIEPDAGSVNPFRPGVLRDAAARAYTLRVRFEPSPSEPEPNTIYIPENRTAGPVHARDPGGYIMYRIYDPDEGMGPEGGVPVPTVTTHLDGVEGPVAAPFERADCQQTRDAEPPVDIDDTVRDLSFPRELRRGSGGGTVSWGATGGTGTFPFINPDNTYLSATPTLTSGDVLVIRGRAPTFADTYRAAVMPPASPEDPAPQVRYWSYCTYDLGLRAVDCRADRAVELEEDGSYTIVISPADGRPEGTRNWISWPVTPVMLLLYRQLRVDPGYEQSIEYCRSRYSGEAVMNCMGEYAPVGTYCTLETFAAGTCPAPPEEVP